MLIKVQHCQSRNETINRYLILHAKTTRLEKIVTLTVSFTELNRAYFRIKMHRIRLRDLLMTSMTILSLQLRIC